jgi:hypothetical protein
MPDFAKAARQIAGESVFTHVELEKLYESEEERAKCVEVQKVLKEAASVNQATKRVLEMGEEAVRVLVKLGRYCLTP